MKKLIAAVLMMMYFCETAAQKVLSEEAFIAVVKKFHPVVKQAANNVGIAEWNITSSRSNFDPQWSSSHYEKELSGTQYYSQTINEIKIPTWYGIDLYAGQETMNGERLNPQETKGTINYLGFSVPVLQNMIMDKRRAAVLQAKNMRALTVAETQASVNDLLREALDSYWLWWKQYEIYQLISQALQNANDRFGLVKKAFVLGDRPAIDTVEALAQVQSLQIMQSEAFAEYMKAQLSLSVYLWAENGKQAELPADAIPADAESIQVRTLTEFLQSVNTHPELQQYGFKLKGLQIEKRLKFQELLPEVKLKYNQLGRGFSKTISQPWMQNNYRYGVSFQMPLRLSEGRGEYAKAKLKIENTLIEQEYKQTQLRTKVQQYFTEWEQLQNQLSYQASLLQNVASLQRAEQTRFSNGESSLFLINTRALKTIETEQKLIELKAKNKTAGIKLQWAAGLLVQ